MNDACTLRCTLRNVLRNSIDYVKKQIQWSENNKTTLYDRKTEWIFVFLCFFAEGVISYSVIQGDIKDAGYDGREEGGILVGGIGQLCDGRHGANEPFTKSTSNFRLWKICVSIIKYVVQLDEKYLLMFFDHRLLVINILSGHRKKTGDLFTSNI